jgi:hypothetical protein
VAIKAKACFQSQRVAGTEAYRLHIAIGQQPVIDSLDVACCEGKFIAILAGVARTSEVKFNTIELSRGRRHEGEAGCLRTIARKHRFGLRTLKRQERAILGLNKRHIRRQILLEPNIVDRFARSVDDEHQHAVIGGRNRSRDH